MNIEGAPLPAGSRSAAMCGRGPGATAWTGVATGAGVAPREHANLCAAGVAGRARRGVHRVLGRGRSRRCRLVGILENGRSTGHRTPRRRRKVRSSREGSAPYPAGAFCRGSRLRAGTRRACGAALVAVTFAPAAAAPARLSRQLGQPARREAAIPRARQRPLDSYDARGALGCARPIQTVARAAARAASAAARALAAVQGAAT